MKEFFLFSVLVSFSVFGFDELTEDELADEEVVLVDRSKSHAEICQFEGLDLGRMAEIGQVLKVVHCTAPEYPFRAIVEKISGKVVVKLDVNSQTGRVENVEVLEASPEGVFDGAVIDAAKSYVFDINAEEKLVEVVMPFEFKFKVN